MEREGFQGLFKGLSPKMVQTTLNSAIMLMIYEKVRGTLKKRMA